MTRKPSALECDWAAMRQAAATAALLAGQRYAMTRSDSDLAALDAALLAFAAFV